MRQETIERKNDHIVSPAMIDRPFFTRPGWLIRRAES